MNFLQLNKWPSTAIGCLVLAISMSCLYMSQAQAGIDTEYKAVVNGYRSCYFLSNNNGTSTIQVSIDWKAISISENNGAVESRGIFFYAYNEKGSAVTTQHVARSVTMNDKPAAGVTQQGYFVKYHGQGLPSSSIWRTTTPFVSTVKIVLNDDQIKQWPVVGLRAGQYNNYADIGDLNLVFFSPGNKSGECRISSTPNNPPRPDALYIDMQAPDWYLGELNPGEDVRIPFNAQKDQMCFGYKGNNFHNYEEYLIEASNSNGKTPDNSRYLLKHFSDTQAPAVPYYITLNDGSTSLRLPNTDKKIFKLNNNGKFCFMPTFQVTTPRKVKHGNYGDVLTYTIISKS